MSFLPGDAIPATAAELIEHLHKEGVMPPFPAVEAFDGATGAYRYGLEAGRRLLVEQLHQRLHPPKKTSLPVRGVPHRSTPSPT